MHTIVGVSDVRVSNNTSEIITTYALGSCLGITIYDPVNKIGGLLHVMLPLSKADPEKAKLKPAMYVDSGFARLLEGCYDLGADKCNMKIFVAGGASMRVDNKDDYFKIGQRNLTTLRKLLWKNGFIIDFQDVGGHKSRTMSLQISDGLVTINKVPVRESTSNRSMQFNKQL